MDDGVAPENSESGKPQPPVTPEAQEEKVLNEVRKQAAMPLLEIPGATGVRGADLEKAVQNLEQKRLVEVRTPEDPLNAIVTAKDPK